MTPYKLEKLEYATEEDLNDALFSVLEDENIKSILTIQGVLDLVRKGYEDCMVDEWYSNLNEMDKCKIAVSALNKYHKNKDARLTEHAINLVTDSLGIDLCSNSFVRLTDSGGKFITYIVTDEWNCICYNESTNNYILCPAPFQPHQPNT